MAEHVEETAAERQPLSRERVLRGAVEVADAAGISGLTIRSLAQHLGVKPMSLYYYVANKGEILDGIVDLVFGDIQLPSPDGEWREEVLRRSRSVRRVLREHPWAIGLMESRKAPGQATLRHHNAMIGTLRSSGLSVEATAHAYALIDSYVYGFALQEASLPFTADSTHDVVASIMQAFADGQYPYFVEMTTEYILKPGYDFANEFEIGFGIILDALARSIPPAGAGQAAEPG